MARFRSKIRFIEAHQIPEFNDDPEAAGAKEAGIYDWVKANTLGEFDYNPDDAPPSGVAMDLENGGMMIAIGGVWYKADPGDWIVLDEGMVYLISEEALLKTYDSIEESKDEETK